MKNLFFISAIFVQSLLFSHAEKSPCLRALIIYDSPASPKLATSYRVDVKRVKENLRGIASLTKLRLKLRILKANPISTHKVNKWIHGIPKASQDVVFFYYVGRKSSSNMTAKGANPWSSITFQSKTRRCPGMLSADEIAEGIKNQNPRFSLILFDCYDRLVRIPPYSIVIGQPISKARSSQIVKKLFLDARGSIKACSGYETSTAGILRSRPVGGLFTIKFLSTLRDLSENLTWNEFLKKVNYYCRYDRYAKQTPLIKVDVVNS
jgi:hypothetical protein